jgi:hypothetical protein
MAQVEREYQMGGLSDGIYGDFARDVAQLVARECAKLADDKAVEIRLYCNEAHVAAVADAIKARFGLEG